MSNVIQMPRHKGEKSKRTKSVEASETKIGKLEVPGRHYVEPAQRVHTRIPPTLHVRVGKDGTKAFAISIRVRDAKTGKPAKRRDITLGRFPAISLAEAIDRGWELVLAADRGIDPNAQRDQYREMAASVPSVDALLDVYEQASANRTASDIVKAIRRALPEDVLKMSAALVGVQDVVPGLKAIARSGRKPTAVRTRSYISGFLTWVREHHDYELSDWVEGYTPTAPKVARDRVLTFEELDQVLATADEHLAPYWRNLIWMLVLTGLRRDEVANGQWDEIDLKERTWTIPAARMKKSQQHIVPLTDRMVEILQDQRRWQRERKMKTPWVFTSNGASPLQGHSKMKQRLDRYCEIDHWVVHDLRRTISTRLAEDLDVDDGLCDLILTHKRRGVEGTYNRSTRFEARRLSHERWELAVSGTGPRKLP